MPCNMVSEVQYDGDMDPMRQHGPNDPWAHLPVRKMIALYDYDPQELSPNVDAEVRYVDPFYFPSFDSVNGFVDALLITLFFA